MARRSYRVSDKFDLSLKYIQDRSKADGIAKTQEQILDEMMNLYLLYTSEDKDIFITSQMEKNLINVNNLFLAKQASLINAVIENVKNQSEEIKNLLSKVAK